MSELFSKIKEVTEIAAVSGHEAPVRNYLRKKMTPHVDEVVTDGLGGIFGVKHSETVDAPRVLVAAHMDEVGFMVSEIKPDGTFRVVQIGLKILFLTVDLLIKQKLKATAFVQAIRLYQTALLFSQLMGKTLSQKLGTIVTVSSW